MSPYEGPHVRSTIRLRDGVWRRVRMAARAEGISMNRWLERAVARRLGLRVAEARGPDGAEVPATDRRGDDGAGRRVPGAGCRLGPIC